MATRINADEHPARRALRNLKAYIDDPNPSRQQTVDAVKLLARAVIWLARREMRRDV